MKKTIQTLLLMAVLLFSGAVQHANAQSPVSLGVKGALNIADFINTDSDFSTRSGLSAGLALEIRPPLMAFGIETGLYYTQKGAEVGDSTIKLDYLQVPVLAKFGFGPPGPLSPHLFIGPFVGFNVNAELDGNLGDVNFVVDISDDAKDVEFGAIFGLGADLNLVATTLNFHVKYDLGVSSAFSGVDERNGVFAIGVGIMF
ncbi:MAG: porin family protein [Balneolaceae bacterium]